jgi:protein required for attachment to host cells
VCGPIQGAEEWQEKFIKKITESKYKKNIIVASPRRLEKSKDFKYDEQVD